MVLNLKKINAFKIIITAFLVVVFAVLIISCGKGAFIKEQPAGEQQQDQIKENEVIIDSSENKEESKPVETEIVENVDAPEIPGLTFNQETKKYLNESGIEVGIWIENAVKINEEMSPAIALKPEAINKILEENKEKGIFKCPWPFDWQENKGIEIVELFNNPLDEKKFFERMGAYLPDMIGIKYTEPIDFYAPFDVTFGNIIENIPDKEGPDFYSAQPWKSIGFGIKDLGGFQYNFIDWNPSVELSEAENYGDDVYYQKILSVIKCGNFVGGILPSTTDFNFLDFTNNEEFYENPGEFQGRLMITDSSDDSSKPTSSLEKMLKYENKAGHEIPVCVWPEENTAHEQTN